PFEIKPVPEIEIGLGMEGLGNTNAGGSGQNDDDIATSEEAAVAPAVTNNSPNIITDDTEESAVVKTNPNNKNDAKTDANPAEEPKQDAELLNALAALKNKKKHDGKGEGDGNTGGSGTGSQKGVGDGDGTGHGNNTPGYNGGGGYDLKGRMLVKKPEKMTDSEEEGIVVVEIIVNEAGKVIKATPGMRGSTTTSSNLYAKARQAAMSVKFNASPEGITEQRGTYTFKFTLE
ncbi:MAG: energy transducer TonB, partial [Bacteroidia bacterium]|nr:energy transducer TonB [Bacteroidia bacterium]